MELAPTRPNVVLRRQTGGEPVVVLAFPYDPHIVAAVRGIPHRRFDWDSREWSAPVDDWTGVHVAEVLSRFPELTTSPGVDAWLGAIEERWIGRVTTARHDGRGWLVLDTRAGRVPPVLAEGAIARADGRLLVAITAAAAEELREQASARLDAAAERCLAAAELGDVPPPARLVLADGVDGLRLRLDVLWDPAVGAAFAALPGTSAGRMAPDPWATPALDAFLALHEVEVSPPAVELLAALREEHEQAAAAVRSSRATSAPPIPEVAAVLGGELQPFQWAGVRYVLAARSAFLADEQGLGKTLEALAAVEADGAYPAVVVCPASLKLNWERETAKWLPHRSVAVVAGRGGSPPAVDIVIVNYEIVAAHREALARRAPRALIIDESHYCKNPQAKRTQAVRRLSAGVRADGMRLALTGTPVLNHADELIAQLRVIGRLGDFGSGARFSRQFQGDRSEERLHWHLRRRCFVRRLKRDVLPQLPAKRQVVVPIALSNQAEYRLAEHDVIAWLRSQPLDLSTLNARIASTLRAERLAQLGTLQRLAARGKLHGALSWIHDFLASGEALVVFARHVEVQQAVLERFAWAAHLRGSDSIAAREEAIAAFQRPDGPALIVCATRVAAQGITLTRASNVAFLELEWTPAMHDQAEDRCHRIGQRDAVSAYYLLAAETIDETMARLIAHKRGVIDAVTDGRIAAGEGLVEAVVRELRDGKPFQHLRPVA
ncbi:MAG: SWI/SNF-related matrix-associated actin-dependent regulator of chromatin subfamily A-like protein 1 [Solirubrobacteraceae bacterium]|jgi:superfamily II DNA or RNA helicase|nr:SWI/SNF-related matrix-associated actin-dependent regulator of chromatin subfamily A-like protein 1 [Solirubrobacteraceae bacterium]